jgi:hypothetical protein
VILLRLARFGSNLLHLLWETEVKQDPAPMRMNAGNSAQALTQGLTEREVNGEMTARMDRKVSAAMPGITLQI